MTRNATRAKWHAYMKNSDKFFTYQRVESILFQKGYFRTNATFLDKMNMGYGNLFYGNSHYSHLFRTSTGTAEGMFSRTPPYPSLDNDIWYYMGYTGGIAAGKYLLDE